MSDTNQIKNQVKSKLEIIKKLNDNPKKSLTNLQDQYLKDLPSSDQYGKKIGDFLDKKVRKKDNTSNIFGDVIDIVEGFVGVNKKRTDPTKISPQGQIKQSVVDALKTTLDSSKQIVMDNVNKVFFSDVGGSICGTNTSIKSDTLTLAPQEFDFLNLLTVDPSSTTGQMAYEPLSPDKGKEKVNRKLYEAFTTPYQFNTINNKTLFTMEWDSPNQRYNVSGLTQGGITSINIGEFFSDYYSTMEYPDIAGVIKSAILMTLQGGEGSNTLFQASFNDLNRLITKLFSICGSPKKGQELKQNAIDQFNENDEDVESYFDFDDVEGIDLDEESARFRKVLKFRDCNNFEVPVNNSIIDDFVYLSPKKSLNDLVNTTLSKASSDAYDQSDSSIPMMNFNISINKSYILNLPRALILNAMTPKLFLPIVMIYKLVKNSVGTLNIKDVMKKLSKLFGNIVKNLFWKFIGEFWKLIKRELLGFVKRIAANILKNKRKKYLTIISSLISLLLTLLEQKIDNCYAIFNIVLTTINTSLRGRINQKVPALLLSLSGQLPGYSTDRAYMNVAERLQAAGVSLSPLYGETNKLPSMLKALIDGHSEEQDTNGFIAGGNKLFTIPSTTGPIIFPPGIISVFGKMM